MANICKHFNNICTIPFILVFLVAVLTSPDVLSAKKMKAKEVQTLVTAIEIGQKLYDDYLYEDAIAKVAPILEKTKKVSKKNRLAHKKEITEGYRILAFSNIALERYDDAVNAFRHLLVLDPEYTLGNVSPKIKKAFLAAGKQDDKPASSQPAASPSASGPSIEHTQVQSVRAGEPVTIRAGVEINAKELRLHYRKRSSGSFKKTKMLDVGKGIYVAVIPGRYTSGAKKIQYYIEAIGSGGEVGLAGSADAPLGIRVEPKPKDDSKPRDPKIPDDVFSDDF